MLADKGPWANWKLCYIPFLMNAGKTFILRFWLESDNFLLCWHEAEPHTPILLGASQEGFVTVLQTLDIEGIKKTMKGKMNKTYEILKPHAWNDTGAVYFHCLLDKGKSLGLGSLLLCKIYVFNIYDSVWMKEVILEELPKQRTELIYFFTSKRDLRGSVKHCSLIPRHPRPPSQAATRETPLTEAYPPKLPRKEAHRIQGTWLEG